jgi:hypothetical protein
MLTFVITQSHYEMAFRAYIFVHYAVEEKAYFRYSKLSYGEFFPLPLSFIPEIQRLSGLFFGSQ